MVACLETDDVAAEHALADRGAHLAGQQPPVVGIRPRDMDEVLDGRVWTLLTDHLADEVELVVLQEDDGLTATTGALAGGDDLVGEHPVYLDVAVAPGVPGLVGDVGSAGGVPQVVLEEPEQGIADLVVVLVVGLLVGHDKAKAEPGAALGWRDDLLAAPARHGPALAVAGGHGGGDPDRFLVLEDGADGGDEAAAALAGAELAVADLGERNRTSIRGDDQRMLAH